jgi:uncharacterized membrane protein YbaN (DUF454 family)
MWQIKTFMLEWKFKDNRARLRMLLGAFFLLLALIGIFLPIIPQVPFAIISAFFFSTGSPLIHQWMRHNKYFGRSVRDWEDQVIRPKMKAIGTFSLIAGAVIGHLKFDLPWALALDVIFLMSVAFILTRKSKRFSFL